jgi:hypothetical protein
VGVSGAADWAAGAATNTAPDMLAELLGPGLTGADAAPGSWCTTGTGSGWGHSGSGGGTAATMTAADALNDTAGTQSPRQSVPLVFPPVVGAEKEAAGGSHLAAAEVRRGAQCPPPAAALCPTRKRAQPEAPPSLLGTHAPEHHRRPAVAATAATTVALRGGASAWECRACTFAGNRAIHLRCEVCDTPKGSDAPVFAGANAPSRRGAPRGGRGSRPTRASAAAATRQLTLK